MHYNTTACQAVEVGVYLTKLDKSCDMIRYININVKKTEELLIPGTRVYNIKVMCQM